MLKVAIFALPQPFLLQVCKNPPISTACGPYAVSASPLITLLEEKNCFGLRLSCRDSFYSPWPAIHGLIKSDWLPPWCREHQGRPFGFLLLPRTWEEKQKGSKGETKTHWWTDWHRLWYVSPDCVSTRLSEGKVHPAERTSPITLASEEPSVQRGVQRRRKEWKVKSMTRDACLTFSNIFNIFLINNLGVNLIPTFFFVWRKQNVVCCLF